MLEYGYQTQLVEVLYEESKGKGTWVRVILREGCKRQIRETCKQLALPVVRIVRTRIETLRQSNLKP